MAVSFEKSLSGAELAALRLKVRELSRIEPWRAFLALGLDWLVIGAAIYMAERFFSPAVYLLALAVITSRQHALGILVHDAAHFRLVQSPRANTVLSNLICAYPLFFHMEMYRHNHLLHHQYTNEPQDPDQIVQSKLPDWQFPMPLGKLLRVYTLDFIGRGAIANWKRVARYNTDPEFRRALGPELARSKWLRFGFYAAGMILLSLGGGWMIYLAYWIVPLLWLLPAILRLRNMAEHYGLSWKNDLEGSRDVLCGPLEAWLLAPHAVNFHLAHHFYPSVPFYRLPELRKYLDQLRAFHTQAHTNSTYLLPWRKAVWRDWLNVHRVVS